MRSGVSVARPRAAVCAWHLQEPEQGSGGGGAAAGGGTGRGRAQRLHSAWLGSPRHPRERGSRQHRALQPPCVVLPGLSLRCSRAAATTVAQCLTNEVFIPMQSCDSCKISGNISTVYPDMLLFSVEPSHYSLTSFLVRNIALQYWATLQIFDVCDVFGVLIQLSDVEKSISV